MGKSPTCQGNLIHYTLPGVHNRARPDSQQPKEIYEVKDGTEVKETKLINESKTM